MSSRPLSHRTLRALDTLECAVRDVQAVLRDAAPGSTSGEDAKAFVDLFAQAERAAASGIALYAPRVAETGAHAKDGHASAADWLGSISGSSPGVAKGRLSAAKRASGDEALTKALHEGELSSAQLKLLGDAEMAAPGSAQTLLDLSEKGASHQELSDAATRLSAAARSRETERLRRQRVHERRHFRWRQCPDGGVRGEFFCDEVRWARVQPELEAQAKDRWRLAGSKDGDSLEAHRLDAFLGFMAAGGSGSGGSGVGGSGGSGVGGSGVGGSERCADDGTDPDDGAPGSGLSRRSKRGSRVQTLVIIDAEALRRGTTEGDELCEIEGIGPVSVAAATELLSEGGLRYLVKEGFDIKTVTTSTRAVATCIDLALLVRDRTCCVPGCGKRLGLERDHVFVDYSDDGPTALDNLVRICPEHHALKTFGGFTLEGTPGNFRWVPPAHPKSAGAIFRARRVATARGKANAEARVEVKADAAAKAGANGNRNRPRRT